MISEAAGDGSYMAILPATITQYRNSVPLDELVDLCWASLMHD
jgi:hypothetical protein